MSDMKKFEDLPVPTHLGWKHWYDHTLYAGWHVQKHVKQDLYRLLDPNRKKKASGTLKECVEVLDAKKAEGLKPRGSHLVLLVPGLNNAPIYFRQVEAAFLEAGYECMTLDYPTAYTDARGHAKKLSEIIDRLEGVETLSLVTHSFGGLIVRAMLAQENEWVERLKLGRIVMVAPPHGGSFLADFIHEKEKLRGLFDWVCGRIGYDLTSKGASELPELKFPVGIIVGGSGKKYGFNPLTDEDNDGLVSLDSARVEAATDYTQVSGWSHTVMLWSPDTIRQVMAFIETGGFSREAGSSAHPKP